MERHFRQDVQYFSTIALDRALNTENDSWGTANRLRSTAFAKAFFDLIDYPKAGEIELNVVIRMSMLLLIRAGSVY